MIKKYNVLPLIPLLSNNEYHHPPELPELAHLDDPATNVMTDFNIIKPITIRSDASIDKAQSKMAVSRIHSLMVSNENCHVIGIITSEDILGSKPLKVIKERKIHHDDILVRMLMTPLESMQVIDYEEVQHARVGDIVETLHHIRKHKAIVVEIDEKHEKHFIRGLFSSSQISKQLGTNIMSNIGEAHYLGELLKDLKSR